MIACRARTVLLVLLVVTAVGLGRLRPPGRPLVPPPPVEPTAYMVDYVVDGDTINAVGLGRVRIIGVDTPEQEEPGFEEATEFTRRACEGEWVDIEICPVKPIDKYDRSRGIVYYADSEGTRRNLAEELIVRALGHAAPLQPCHIDDSFWLGLQVLGRNFRGAGGVVTGGGESPRPPKPREAPTR